MKKLLIIIVLSILLIVILALRIRLSYEKAQSADEFIISVYGHKVGSRDIVLTKKFTGTLRSTNQVELSPQVTQRVKQINFKEGDSVKKGDTIALLENKDILLKKDQAVRKKDAMLAQTESLKARQAFLKTNMDFLEKEMERSSNLLRQNAISRQSYDIAYNNFQKAYSEFESSVIDMRKSAHEIDILDSQIKEADILLSYTGIKSNIDGIIRRVMIEEGELAVAGRPAVIIDSTDLYKIIFEFPNEDAHLVRPAQKAVLDLNPALSMSVSNIYPSLRDNTFIAEIILDALPTGLLLGSNLTFELITEQRESITAIPSDAVLNDNDNTYVFLIIEDRIQIREVITGISDNYSTEIISGLDEDDLIATGSFLAIKRYRDGQKVHIAGEL